MNVWVWSGVISPQLCCSDWFPKTGLKGTSPIPKWKAGALLPMASAKHHISRPKTPSLKQAREIGGHQVIRQSVKELLVTATSFKYLGEFSVSGPQQCERLFVAKKITVLLNQRCQDSERWVLTISNTVQKVGDEEEQRWGLGRHVLEEARGKYVAGPPRNSQPIWMDRCVSKYQWFNVKWNVREV